MRTAADPVSSHEGIKSIRPTYHASRTVHVVAYTTKYGIMFPVGGFALLSAVRLRIIQFNGQELNRGLVLRVTHRCWMSLKIRLKTRENKRTGIRLELIL